MRAHPSSGGPDESAFTEPPVTDAPVVDASAVHPPVTDTSVRATYPRSIADSAVRAAVANSGTLPAVRSASQTLMGGRSTVTLVGGVDGLIDRVFARADRLESLWSRFRATSDVSRLNSAEGSPIAVDRATLVLIERMLQGAALTHGDYDATLLPEVIAAGYEASTIDPLAITRLPASAKSPGRLDLVSIESAIDGAIHGSIDGAIDGSTVRLPVGTTIDPGGIGKGLAADLLCEFALAEGAWGAMIEIGGDIVVAGDAPDGAAWRLGIEDPRGTGLDRAVVRLSTGALVTSSRLKRRFGADLERHHLIDPTTRRSAITRSHTVSVIATSGARAEVLAKSGFVREHDAYLDWLPSVGAAGLVIDDDGELHASANWNDYR